MSTQRQVYNNVKREHSQNRCISAVLQRRVDNKGDKTMQFKLSLSSDLWLMDINLIESRALDKEYGSQNIKVYLGSGQH